MANKEVSKLIKAIEKQGFTVRRTAKGHHMVLKDKTPVTLLPGTPSDHRSLKNALAYLKQAGFTQ
ncbi:type II toxin-antitoxin system HicA family toxin (plasmid) [Streptomyces globisporus]|uniref:type II toxin-antitoxin system HicA family toxin n=1 Tax=Streptomyces globisporus TaxID=1908 RepID=UPI002F919B97|nr:type II toxin-antitoxin system HicA family toxin [Streptomyces globisporus]